MYTCLSKKWGWISRIQLPVILILIKIFISDIKLWLGDFSESQWAFFYESRCNWNGLERYISEDGEGKWAEMLSGS